MTSFFSSTVKEFVEGKIMVFGDRTRYCLYIVVLLLFSSYSVSASDHVFQVKEGVLDLRSVDATSDFSVNMNGEWEFYPDRFLDPGCKDEYDLKPVYISVPSLWASGEDLSASIKGIGFGTYRCLVILPGGFHNPLGFNIPAFETSYEMFINGELVSSNGKPGKNKSETDPAYFPKIIKYSPHSDSLDIIIKVANFEVCKGGFPNPIKIGSSHPVYESYVDIRFFSAISSAMLFTIFLFSILIFILNKKAIRTLAFSIFIFSLAIRPLFSSPYLIAFVDDFSWIYIYRIKYINLFLILTGGAWFVNLRYPTTISRIGNRISAGFFVLAFPSILILSPYVLSYTDNIINIFATLLVGYALIMSFIKARSRKVIDVISFLSIAFIAFGVYSDIRLSVGKSESRSIFIISFTVLFYAVLQASLLIKEWINNTIEKEDLYVRSEELARELEKRVEERTSELSRKNIEIETQNRFIIEQNKKLTDTISVKNRIFAVISHDLRSPIVNILYGLNLIKDDKSGENIEYLANTCIKNSRQAINLLENMLSWGREQEDLIHYSPGYYNLADIILTNLSIYKENADKKNIRINFTQVGSSNGWFDKDLIDVVVRNLLSNAIKFTGQDGRINIILKENLKPGSLVLKFVDNGVGISTDRLDTLLSEHSIKSTNGTDNEKGTGIGLMLVYDFVKICKGDISVESSPETGTCFTIILPRLESEVLSAQVPDRATII